MPFGQEPRAPKGGGAPLYGVCSPDDTDRSTTWHGVLVAARRIDISCYITLYGNVVHWVSTCAEATVHTVVNKCASSTLVYSPLY